MFDKSKVKCYSTRQSHFPIDFYNTFTTIGNNNNNNNIHILKTTPFSSFYEYSIYDSEFTNIETIYINKDFNDIFFKMIRRRFIKGIFRMDREYANHSDINNIIMSEYKYKFREERLKKLLESK